MRRLDYHWVDVFTDVPFGGNPLAVVLDGRGLDAALMQRIAREFNLSETTFVLPPRDPANDFKVRIFTPTVELPMAGHPTVGTTFVLDRIGKIEPARATVQLELGIGPTAVHIDRDANPGPRIAMDQPAPTFGPEFPDLAAVVEMLGLEKDDLAEGWTPVMASAGVPYLYVQVRDAVALGKIRVRPDRFDSALGGFDTDAIFAFALESYGPARVRGRMFVPQLGVDEDPATGSAAGPLGGLLWRDGLLPHDAEGLAFTLSQGVEMGRPSWIGVEVVLGADEAPRLVRVSGTAVAVAEGVLTLDD